MLSQSPTRSIVDRLTPKEKMESAFLILSVFALLGGVFAFLYICNKYCISDKKVTQNTMRTTKTFMTDSQTSLSS